ncbi:MAG: zinc ribbon domain-containing protein, partial [Thermoplasmata archaeon]
MADGDKDKDQNQQIKCPRCQRLNDPINRTCYNCGFIFPRQQEKKGSLPERAPAGQVGPSQQKQEAAKPLTPEERKRLEKEKEIQRKLELKELEKKKKEEKKEAERKKKEELKKKKEEEKAFKKKISVRKGWKKVSFKSYTSKKSRTETIIDAYVWAGFLVALGLIIEYKLIKSFWLNSSNFETYNNTALVFIFLFLFVGLIIFLFNIKRISNAILAGLALFSLGALAVALPIINARFGLDIGGLSYFPWPPVYIALIVAGLGLAVYGALKARARLGYFTLTFVGLFMLALVPLHAWAGVENFFGDKDTYPYYTVYLSADEPMAGFAIVFLLVAFGFYVVSGAVGTRYDREVEAAEEFY